MEPGEPGNRVFGANITYLILILAAKIYDFLTPIPYAMHFFFLDKSFILLIFYINIPYSETL